MDIVNILIVESDPERRERLRACLAHDADFNIVGTGHDFPSAYQVHLRATKVDVILMNVDQIDLTSIRPWAIIHALLPNARLVALTQGADAPVLEFVLAVGVTALHRLNAEPMVLVQAVRNAAHGVVDSDPWLVERTLRVLLRPSVEPQASFGDLIVDLRSQRVMCRGRLIQLTPLEFRVLAYLASNPSRPSSWVELLAGVWGCSSDRGGTLAQVQNCIRRIRHKIEQDVRHPRYLCCERGWGYFLHDPDGSRTGDSCG